jgi:hypothetical protein
VPLVALVVVPPVAAASGLPRIGALADAGLRRGRDPAAGGRLRAL